MMSQTHRVVNGTSAFVVATAVGMSWEYVGAAIACSAIASSMPDNAEKLLRVHHRRLTHYPLMQVAFFALLVLAVAMMVPVYAGLATVVAAFMAFGCIMHSCADAMTVDRHGIALLWPLSRRGYHLLPWSMRVWVGSKSRSERVFVVVWVAFVLIYAYVHFGRLISA